MAVKVQMDPIGSLSVAERSAMLALLDQHFLGVERTSFNADLDEKSHVLRLLSDEMAVIGFSTIDYRRTTIDSTPCGILYSGDTIVDPGAWASASLSSAWVAAILELHAGAGPPAPLWWLLLTSGLRTYRYLTVCLRQYAPALAPRLDPQAHALLPRLARERFGQAYDAGTGVVTLRHRQRLRPHLSVLPPRLKEDADAQLFLRLNPCHDQGDELASLCRLSEDNLTAVGLVALRRGRLAMAGIRR
jgi:hypothetical protein